MKLFLEETPINIGSILYYNGVKYKLVGVDTCDTENPDEKATVLKMQTIEE